MKMTSAKKVRLFDKKGNIYSSRPSNYIGNELICPRDVHILLLPYGDRWRQHRKIVQSLLNVNEVDKLLPIQNAEAVQTLFHLLQDPEGYYDHIRRYSTAVILASVYGQRGAEFKSPKVQALYNVQDRFTAILEPGAAPPVDAFPFLQYLPEFMCGWKKEAKSIRKDQSSLYFSLLGETKQKIASENIECFLKKLLRDQEKLKLDDEHVAYLGGILVCKSSSYTPRNIADHPSDGGWFRHNCFNAPHLRVGINKVPSSLEKSTN
jgi:cytochrome P450